MQYDFIGVHLKKKSITYLFPHFSLLMRVYSLRLNLHQVMKDFPTSTARKPRGLHRGPHKRQVSEAEQNQWLFMRKAQLVCSAEWDAPENFKHLPKPKKIIGNEASDIVWPYAILLENEVRIHPFIKSIYCYSYQLSLTKTGLHKNNLAKHFARQCMIPLAFHNAQCYVESELLLDYGDSPFFVIHCLDGTSTIIPILFFNTRIAGISGVQKMRSGKQMNKESLPLERPETGASYTHLNLLKDIQAIADYIGNSVEQPQDIWSMYNNRPPQNSYLKINYQWLGDTERERAFHSLNYQWLWGDSPVPMPSTPHREARTSMALDQVPNKIPEVVRLTKSTRRSMLGSNQLNAGQLAFARNADTRAFSGGSRLGAPTRR